MGGRVGILDIFRILPRTNCGDCGEKTCMAFAFLLLERKRVPQDCPYLAEGKKKELEKLLAPRVRLVTFGTAEDTVRIGGEDILYRHQLTYFNPTAFAIEVHDEMDDDTLTSRVSFLNTFRFERVGEKLTLQAAAIRNKSGSEGMFKECVRKVLRITQKALILCSLKASMLEAALDICAKTKPLLYTATKNAWREVGELAIRYECPVVASSESIDELESIVVSLRGMGVGEIVLNPSSHPENLRKTLETFVILRKIATENNETVMNWPLIGIPASVHLQRGRDLMAREVMTGCALMCRFADLLILHSTDMAHLLPLVTLRQGIYTDPRKPKAVDAGLRMIGAVNENSHVLCTTNFALTYYTVESDIKSGNVNCYLIVFDTDGLGVDSSVAGGQLDAFKANEAIKKSEIEGLVTHRRIIIPGLAARISGDLERLSGWEVIVGPRDSSGIPKFIEKLEKERKV